MVENFHFLRPWWLMALLPIVLLTLAILHRQDSHRPWKGIIADHLLKHLLVRGEKRRTVRPVHLLAITWFVTVIALAGPAWRHEKSPFTDDEAALVVVIKVTPSMMAQDIQPSRLERAAQKVRDLLELRPGARTALVAYAGSAHLVMPMTHDARVIEMFSDELSPEIMPREGDATGEALRLAQEQLEPFGQSGSIVLVTDSIPPGQYPELQAHRKANGAPVQIFAVAAPPDVVPPPGSPPAPALDKNALGKASDAIDGTLTLVTPDSRDVETLARHVRTRFIGASPQDDGQRWQDTGYWLTPVIALLCMAWFRRGWIVQWE